jgi:cobalt-precorrin 5A hydrolase
VDAVTGALKQAGEELSDVRFLATADIKADEPGLLAAAETLGLPLRLISSEEIRGCRKAFTSTPLAVEKVNLPAVAEPAALLAGRRTTLILPKTILNSVTVAVARENSLS